MANQRDDCWASIESTNNDHVYHTFEDCHFVERIKDHGNLITLTVGEARWRGMDLCSFCRRRRVAFLHRRI